LRALLRAKPQAGTSHTSHHKTMSPRIWIILGAISGAIGVGLGAYHAHGLEKALAARGLTGDDLQKQMHNFDVGLRYQMYHALALILVGLLAWREPMICLNLAGVFFVAGTLLFSGCLYIPVLAEIKLPWYLVPGGGAAFIAGWIALAVAGLKMKLQ
jgi:uncharacterized membrane protein YgdD (TMEM256/DUF423 family)